MHRVELCVVVYLDQIDRSLGIGRAAGVYSKQATDGRSREALPALEAGKGIYLAAFECRGPYNLPSRSQKASSGWARLPVTQVG